MEISQIQTTFNQSIQYLKDLSQEDKIIIGIASTIFLAIVLVYYFLRRRKFKAKPVQEEKKVTEATQPVLNKLKLGPTTFFEGEHENGTLKKGTIFKELEYQIDGAFTYDEDGFISGNGEYIYPNKRKFIGEIENNEEKNGKVICSNKFQYEIENFELIIPKVTEKNPVTPLPYRGTYELPNGEVREGLMDANHNLIGSGKKKTPHGSLHKGRFNLNLLEGPGTIENKDEKNDGNFSKGRLNGEGERIFKIDEVGTIEEKGTFADNIFVEGTKTIFGDVHIGKFENGLLHGKGEIRFINGVIYKGVFRKGKLYYGCIKKPDGHKRKGLFRKNQLHGLGTIVNQKGQVIAQGYFKNDKLNGFGHLLQEDGILMIGTFENHDLKKGKHFLPDGTVKEIN